LDPVMTLLALLVLGNLVLAGAFSCAALLAE
jgi:hypothetical protein